MKKYEAPKAQLVLFTADRHLANVLNFDYLLNLGKTEEGGQRDAAVTSANDISIKI